MKLPWRSLRISDGDSIEIGLSDLAMDLLVRAIAVLSPAYHQGTAGMIVSMLSIVASKFHRAADLSRRASVSAISSTAPRQSSTIQRFAVRLRELAATDDNDYFVSCS
jgi:hypothetical protein